MSQSIAQKELFIILILEHANPKQVQLLQLKTTLLLQQLNPLKQVYQPYVHLIHRFGVKNNICVLGAQN